MPCRRRFKNNEFRDPPGLPEGGVNLAVADAIRGLSLPAKPPALAAGVGKRSAMRSKFTLRMGFETRLAAPVKMIASSEDWKPDCVL